MEKTTTIEQTVQRLNSSYQKRESLKAGYSSIKIELEKLDKQQRELENTISELETTLRNLVNEG